MEILTVSAVVPLAMLGLFGKKDIQENRVLNGLINKTL